jgi:toxin HigB-1
MISSFRNKGLKELFETGRTSRIDSKLQRKARLILDALDRARVPGHMNVPGFDFQALKGFRPTRYSCHVNGPWCITFEFDAENAAGVDYEQYH